MRHCLLSGVYLFLLISVKAQISPIGSVEVTNYTAKSDPQITHTWSITQSTNGIMFFATSRGYLVFDGKNWKSFRIKDNLAVRCIYADNSGKIYIGASNDFGYLETAESGQLVYHSLASKLKSEFCDLSDVWRIHKIDDRVFFQTSKMVYVLQNDEFKYFPANMLYNLSSVANNTFYLLDQSIGLLEYKNDALLPLPLAIKFRNLNVNQIVPMANNNLLLLAETGGLYIYNKLSLHPWEIPVNEKLKRIVLTRALKVYYNYYILGTEQDGLFIINDEGKLIKHINKSNGLQSNNIRAIFLDKSGNLWIGNDYGIDFIPIASPLTWFDDKYGIEGGVYSSIIHNNNFYVSTNRGVYYNKWDLGNIKSNFNTIELFKGETWTSYLLNDNILFGQHQRSFIIEGNQTKKITDEKGGWIFWQDPEHPGLVFEGIYNGILVYNIVNNSLVFRNKIDGFNISTRVIVKDDEGYYWLARSYKGVYQFRLNEKATGVAEFNFFSIENGCPKNIYVYKIGSDIIFTAKDGGIYRFSKLTNHFEIDEKYSALFNSKSQIIGINTDIQGNIWYFKDNVPSYLKKTPQGYKPISYPELNKLQNVLISGFEGIYPFDSNSVFIYTNNGLAHFNPLLSKRIPIAYNAIINEVKSTSNDSVLFQGFSNNYNLKQKLPFSMNALYFNFSGTFYEVPEKIKFKFRLKGFENNWSEWTDKNYKEYTNLWEGQYAFEVIAKNYMGQESQHATYYFTISPPWYRSKWAYSVYLIIAISIIYFIVQLIKQKFDKQKISLETEKEHEIRKQQKEYKEDLLQAEMEKKNLELASIAMQIAAKNDALTEVLNSLITIAPKVDNEARLLVEELMRKTQGNIDLASDWDKFLDYFDKVHDNFLMKLQNRYNDLTGTDLKLCAYLRMQLSSKEIADLMSISLRGVEKARYRLRKKFNIDPNIDLYQFIISLG
jgi:hypothetical protein